MCTGQRSFCQIPPAKPEACQLEPLKAVENREPPKGGVYPNSSI